MPLRPAEAAERNLPQIRKMQAYLKEMEEFYRA